MSAQSPSRASGIWPFNEGKDMLVKKGFCTPQKVAKIAAMTFLISIISITVVTLIVRYPTGSNIFYSVFSVSAVASFIALAVVCVKKNQQQKIQPNLGLTPAVADVVDFSQQNPFDNAHK